MLPCGTMARGERWHFRRCHQEGGHLNSNRTPDEWIAQYSASHEHPVNQFCHMIGIPVIVGAFVLAAAGQWRLALAAFIVGWIFQFVGHAFEGKPPEFFRDWRFLLVGLRWWVAKVRGRS